MPPRLFPTRLDLPADNRRDLIALLNAHVADLTDLRTQTKYAHWNVKGPTFIALHELFDKLAEGLDELIDDTAERATALGGVALGTVRQAAAASRLPEFPADTFTGLSVVEALAVRYAGVAKSSREAIDAADTLGDADSADLFTAASRELDKALWFLEAHLQG
ncbi:MAG TPA: DNA starvation/stationary phase protection protein Dps [Urbifossiella sp.]|jgi:starvation-inducible DNA-binding protein|nr:DNA starvation/stationary phase protection protein Dps [Urbifossiella sp.]